MVEQLVETAIAEDTHCVVMGLSGTPARNLRALDALKRVPADHMVVTWDEARETAWRLLENDKAEADGADEDA